MRIILLLCALSFAPVSDATWEDIQNCISCNNTCVNTERCDSCMSEISEKEAQRQLSIFNAIQENQMHAVDALKLSAWTKTVCLILQITWEIPRYTKLLKIEI